MIESEISELLFYWAKEVEQNQFAKDDPVQIPRQYSRKEDVEISGFFTAIMAWGQRKTIINKSRELMQLFDNAPHDFIINHTASDLARLNTFKHRTLTHIDVISLIQFFQSHYIEHKSLETAFFSDSVVLEKSDFVYYALAHFSDKFANSPHPRRTEKHISSPKKNSACKRLNLYLRWMIRKNSPVDFGIWNRIGPEHLMCPLDLHVQRVALELGILTRATADWKACVELTNYLKKIYPQDPVYFDYALFGIGVLRQK